MLYVDGGDHTVTDHIYYLGESARVYFTMSDPDLDINKIIFITTDPVGNTQEQQFYVTQYYESMQMYIDVDVAGYTGTWSATIEIEDGEGYTDSITDSFIVRDFLNYATVTGGGKSYASSSYCYVYYDINSLASREVDYIYFDIYARCSDGSIYKDQEIVSDVSPGYTTSGYGMISVPPDKIITEYGIVAGSAEIHIYSF